MVNGRVEWIRRITIRVHIIRRLVLCLLSLARGCRCKRVRLVVTVTPCPSGKILTELRALARARTVCVDGVCVDAGGIARRINLEALHGGLTVGRLAR
jgi:hypothetical protein